MPVLNVIFFPPSRRVALVRRTALVGNGMPNAWRKGQYWQSRVSYLRRKMAEAGMRPRDIELEISAFRAAVAEEVARLRAPAKRPADAAPSASMSRDSRSEQLRAAEGRG